MCFSTCLRGQCFSVGLWELSEFFFRFMGTECFSVVLWGLCVLAGFRGQGFSAGLWGLKVFL